MSATPVSAAELAALRGKCIVPGNLVSLYDVGPVLGKGGFATVRSGVEKSSSKQVALKILNPKAYLRDARQAKQVFQEIEVLQKVQALSNPNVLSFVAAHEDVSATTGLPRLTIVTELCTGGELFDRVVSRGHYSEKDAAELIAKLARALQQCHESGIVHRDLKPENVLYKSKADDAEPVLADFGLSLLRDRADVHSGIIGTPGYLSPEIIASKKYTEAADVWALGVLAYILLCGYPPFYSDKRNPAENHAELYGQIRAGAYAFHEDAWAPISESARALVAGMLTVDEDKRAGLAQVLAHPWVTANVHVAHLPRTIDNLRQFNARRKIRAAAMAVRLGAVGARRKVQSLLGETRLTSEQLAALSTAFHDVAGSGGAVCKAQFVTVMSNVGLTDLPLDRLFEVFDADGSADIDYRELIVGLASLHGAEADDESLRMCFRVYDVDGDGAITLPELVRLLQVLHAHDDASSGASTPLSASLASPGVGGAGAAPAAPAAAASGTFCLTALDSEDASVGALEQLFKRIDSNADGKLSFDEFKAAVKSEPTLAAYLLTPLKRAASGHFAVPAATATATA